MSKEDLLMPARSDSSCSLGKLSTDLSSTDLSTQLSEFCDVTEAVSRVTCGQKPRDSVTLCDTSSEVSDEGYKSSQGNVSKLERENTVQSSLSTHTQGEGASILYIV